MATDSGAAAVRPDRGDDFLFCPCCRSWGSGALRDRSGNPRLCPHCKSLERHRVISLLVPALQRLLTGADTPAADSQTVLDVAPCAALDPTLARLRGARVVRMDLDPDADGRVVDVRASITAIPLDDASVDLLVCSHVLEHVPDDLAAMREIRRVLSPTGLGLVVVPWWDGPTREDPEASPEERTRLFGQADHVRYYGHGFEDRLAAAGLSVERVTARDLVEDWGLGLCRLLPDERFWLVRADDSELKLPTTLRLGQVVGAALWEALGAAASTVATLSAELEAARADLDTARGRVDYLQPRYERAVARFERLRRRPVVRALTASDRLRRSLRDRLRSRPR